MEMGRTRWSHAPTETGSHNHLVVPEALSDDETDQDGDSRTIWMCTKRIGLIFRQTVVMEAKK